MTGADFSGVDIDLLADYIGGVLTGTPDESAVAARIADDPAWRMAYESLGEGITQVAAELGRLAPEHMPSDLADRLDTLLTSAALHEGSLSGAAIGSTTGEQPAELPDAVTDPERSTPDLAQPSVRHLRLVRDGEGAGGPAKGDRARDGDGPVVGDGAHGVPETQPEPRRGRRLKWVAPIAVAAGVVAFIGFGLDYLAGTQRHTDSATDSSGSALSGARGEAPEYSGAQSTLASGIDYTHDTLGIAPVQPFSGATTRTPSRKSAPQMADGVASALQRLAAPTALADCLAAIERANAGGTLSVESVDYARFAGSPAVIVRFSASNGHWAWASGPECGTPPGDAATLDKVPVG